MTEFELTSIILSGLAIIISGLTAFKTLLSRFNGKVSFSNTLSMLKIDNIPSIGLAAFFENIGAKAGSLDDLRLHVKNIGNGSEYDFYPILMRNDYNIYKSYKTIDWYVFSSILLEGKSSVEKYILFKPLYDEFKTSPGIISVRLDVKWCNKNKWSMINPIFTFDLSKELSDSWANPDIPTFTILSNEAMKIRGIYG